MSTRPPGFEELELDLQRYELRRGNTVLRLEKIPMELLILLVENRDRLVRREEIIERLWGKDAFLDTEQGINTAIRKIRQLLRDDPERPRFVQTVFGKGYRFVAPILVTHNGLQSRTETEILVVPPESDPEDRHQPAREVLVNSQPLVGHSPAASSPPAPRGKFPRWSFAMSAWAAVIVLAVVALGIYFWKSRPPALSLEGMHIGRLLDSDNAEDAAISPNGQYVVYVMRDGEKRSLRVRQVATGSDVQILSPEVVRLHGLTISPDGNYVFFSRSSGENLKISILYEMPVLGGTPQELIRDVDTPISFSPNGKQFAFVRGTENGDRDDLVLSNSDGSNVRVLAGPGPGPEVGPAWSPDGKKIAFVTYDYNGERYIWAVSPSDGTKKLIYSSHSLIGRVLWLPDGSGLLAMVLDSAQGYQGQLWYIAYPGGVAKRFTNDLTDYATTVLDLTRDGKFLVTIENAISSDLWVSPENGTPAQQLSSGNSAIVNLSASAAGRVAFVDSKGDLYSIQSNGRDRRLLQANRVSLAISVCGDGRIVFDSETDGRWNIWRVNADGSHSIQLTQSGSAILPLCSPDGQSVLYCDREGEWGVTIDGGNPIQIPMPNGCGPWMSYSPDGKFMAYILNGSLKTPQDRLNVSPSAGRETIYSFPWPAGARCLRWAPDGSGLDFILTSNQVGNIWRQPLPNGSPRQITNFTSGLLFSFDWSHDGEELYVARGSRTSNIILISNFR